MREFEAFSCDDVDSIHNDYQRVRGNRWYQKIAFAAHINFACLQHLIYLWTMPDFERQKLIKWASGQAPDGHIQVHELGWSSSCSFP